MLRHFVKNALAPRLIAYAQKTQPSFVIGEDSDPYLVRWWLIPKNRFFNVYLHYFLRSDDDRALHDHPWWNLSILLAGSYCEHTIENGGVNVRVRRTAGVIKFRKAKSAHRIELTDGPCWTLFITGPKIREWGFHCPKGWRHWQDFCSRNADGSNAGGVGRGCE